MNGSKNIIPNHTRGSQTCYKIRSADGELVAIHVRRDTPDGGKKMWWERPGGKRGLNGTKLADLPLYNSEHVADWPADWPLVLTEGEKPADALMQVSIKALGTVTGAASEPGDDALEILRDREVILWPDADKAGRSHMERIARRLQGMTETVRWYEDPDAADGEDAADHPAIVSGGDRRQGMLLNDLLCAPEWKLPEPSANGYHTDKDIEVVCAAEVTLKVVRWFWRRRIPFGKLTIFDGDPDLGKSVVTVDIAARGTTGRTFPDGEPCEIGNVLIFNIEDAADDTVVPRLKAVGADLNRVYLFSSIPDGKGALGFSASPKMCRS